MTVTVPGSSGASRNRAAPTPCGADRELCRARAGEVYAGAILLADEGMQIAT